jgi:hypothetical protein
MTKSIFKAFGADLEAAYSSSTASSPVDLGAVDWNTLNNLGSYTKKVYGVLAAWQKKGENSNGGYLRLSSSAIDDGFDLKQLSGSFFKNFDFTKNYTGEISKVFPENGSSQFKSSAFPNLKWDTLPYESMSIAQASSIDWGKISFNKGDLEKLDLSKVEWNELKKKGIKTFEKYFTKLKDDSKISMLEGLDADTLREMGEEISYKSLFGKKEAKKLDQKSLNLKIDGQDFTLVGQDMAWPIANAYARMQGFELANMNEYGDDIQSIRASIVNIANQYESLTADGKFSSKDILDLYLGNFSDTNNLAPVFDIKAKKLMKGDFSQLEDLIDKINKFNLDSTLGPQEEHEVWVGNPQEASPQILLNLINGDQRELEGSGVNDTFFALYEV